LCTAEDKSNKSTEEASKWNPPNAHCDFYREGHIANRFRSSGTIP